jgi:hypothetical protein
MQDLLSIYILTKNELPGHLLYVIIIEARYGWQFEANAIKYGAIYGEL